jgi:beta-galactosidase
MIFDCRVSGRTTRKLCFHVAAALLTSVSIAQTSGNPAHAKWPGPGELFVGACYQPIDRSPEEIDSDIAFMKGAGFNVVRMGDLSWDSFEPSEGQFNFEWFDHVMDKMHAAGIHVVLDIPGSPAPIWLHRAYPGVDIVNQSGDRVPPAERYMDDISDPDYRREVGILGKTMMEHYAHHPALIAIGYNNEIGNGYMSYSPAVRLRFIGWLKNKYGSIEALNKAWATQRWSRRLSSFDDVDLPLGDGPGPSERFLDLHRFWSDTTVSLLEDLDEERRRIIPDLPAISNLWDNSSRRGFDYLSTYRSYVSYGAEGFYPGDPVSGAFGAVMIKGDLLTPIWFNEFTAGGGGFYGTPGRSRMYAYLGLLLGSQATLAWTFNSHLGGEEQALFGLIDHDNTASWKLGEFARLAAEFKKLQQMGFPRYPHAQVAIAYSFESFVDSHPNGPSSTTLQYFKYPYAQQVQGAFEPVFRSNVDVNIVNVGHADLSSYKLVVVPADYLMDEASARALRDYVRSGGTVLMTAFSAKVNEFGQWFDTPLPGRLSDVFGIKVNAFYETPTPLHYQLSGTDYVTDARFFEAPKLMGATALANFTGKESSTAAITVHRFGNGQALYFAMPSTAQTMTPILSYLMKTIGIPFGPATPDGVYARTVEGRTLYVNTTETPQHVIIQGTSRSALSGELVRDQFNLPPLGVDLLQPETSHLPGTRAK